MVTQLAPVLTANEAALRRSGRALIGWLNEQEATMLLLGARTPGPDDDTTPIRATIAACHGAVQARPAYIPTDPVVEPDNEESRLALAAIAARPDVQAGFGPHRWRPALIDLREVLSLQKIINLEGMEDRLAPVRAGVASLVDFCLPESSTAPSSDVLTNDNGKGLTISSLNPNLRFAGSHAAPLLVNQPSGPPLSMLGLTFAVMMGASFLNVAAYKNRYILRDGYHRATGLLRAGIAVAPCIVIDAGSFEEIALPGMIGYETLYGDHPPRLSDFWDETVSREFTQPMTRKVVRIRVDEFEVHV